MEQQLYCGASKRCITPDEKLISDLRGLMDQKLGGVLDELYVRVLILKSRGVFMVYTVFELDKAPDPSRYFKELRTAYGLKEENIFLTAVHTHSAPVSGDRRHEGPNNIAIKSAEVQTATAAYEEFVNERFLEAVKDAMEHMVPARMGYTFAESRINVDRKQWYEYTDRRGRKHSKLALGSNYASPVDRTVHILKFEDLSGNPICFWMNYPVHCCVLHTNRCCGETLGISGDIAGKVCKYMEDEFKGAVAVWSSGAAGDINPVMQNEIYYPEPDSGDMVTFRMPGCDCRYLLTLLATNHYDDIRRALSGIVCGIPAPEISGCVQWVRTPGQKGDYEVRLHMMKLGSMILLGGSGEFYGSYAELARNLIPEKPVIIVNHDASLCADSGYIFNEQTLLVPEKDLPGAEHTNMLPGYFEAAYVEHVRNMYAEITESRTQVHGRKHCAPEDIPTGNE